MSEKAKERLDEAGKEFKEAIDGLRKEVIYHAGDGLTYSHGNCNFSGKNGSQPNPTGMRLEP